MSERPIADVGPRACPFVAFEHDQARRSVEPDRRHRCYAEPVPAPRAIAHQSTYCLSSGFSACPTFRAWAQRTAARQAEEHPEVPSKPVREVPVAPMPQTAAPGAMGLVADDSRPAVRAAGAAGTAAGGSDVGARSSQPPPAWAAPPPWGSTDAEGDEELASLVRPIESVDAEIDAGDVPAFLTGRSPSSTSDVGSRGSTGASAAGGAAASGSSPGARPRSSVGQARPASRALRRPARIDADAPAWETPRRFEAYPTLRTRMGMPRVPTIALAAVALVAAALLLLVLPSIVAGPTATPTPTPQPSVATEAPVTLEPAPTPQTYVVVAGDTISKIARKFGITPEELLAANPQVKNPNKIKVGDELAIPAPESDALPSLEAEPSEESAPSP